MEKYRKAGVLWTGDLKNGSGIVSTESRALFEYPINSRMRFENESGTNPEELIAAAHAACFSMALAGVLAKNGYEPVRTDTTATCILASKDGGGWKITTMQLHIRGRNPRDRCGDVRKTDSGDGGWMPGFQSPAQWIGY